MGKKWLVFKETVDKGSALLKKYGPSIVHKEYAYTIFLKNEYSSRCE